MNLLSVLLKNKENRRETLSLSQVAQGGCDVSTLLDTQKSSGHSPGLSAALNMQGELDQIVF